MKATIRRIQSMGVRALEFCTAHPDAGAGYAAATARLSALLLELTQLATEQRAGVTAERASVATKQELRTALEQSELLHLSSVVTAAADALPALVPVFSRVRESRSYQAFRTAAQAMLDAARQHQEALVPFGLSEAVLTSVGEKLAAFDQAMDATATARRQHVRAARALEEAGNELNQVVRVLDGFNRFRFAKEPDLLAAWRSAANVLGPSRPATPDEPTTPMLLPNPVGGVGQ
ncbi:MAG: hypothetical protein IPI92_11710 [Gemmatimonadetes bacterium]|nr:hypothetical protein [Gemmatimonadota bacterium]MBK6779787.1 hypothetical protein [Gemmatimonadota bacterium]MBK7350520.1 hypothetical protein [Gemmatimonadota bacterium]MBK7785666.1 hypothetical protein [Gemmatimonadota bacterium]MBK9067377.1 hypothetical protein [Gemmatimonadota bacterium]